MQDTLRRVAQQAEHRYYGKFRGLVVDNADPEKRCRLRLRVPSVLATEVTAWALPCLPFGGLADHGLFVAPEVDAQVWVEFEEGRLSRPIWTGTFWQQSGDPPTEAGADPPTTRLLKTPGGHLLRFDDEKDKEVVELAHVSGAALKIDEKGSVALTDAKGARLTLDADAGELVLEDANGNRLAMTSSGTTVEDANGNKIDMAASGITAKGQKIVIEGSQVLLAGQGGEPIIKGQSFLTLFATHVHPTAWGPSGPPIPQGEMTTLSTKVMTL